MTNSQKYDDIKYVLTSTDYLQSDAYWNILILTHMLLVANLDNAKWCKKPKLWLKPWHMGTHLSAQRELPNEYQHDGLDGFKNICVIVLWKG